MCAIDITAEQRKTVLALLARHLPNTTAWVYGSRVKWTSRPESDLDLVVFAKPEQERRVSDLREAFEESNLPFRVDLFVGDEVPEQFRKTIEAERVVLVERGELGVGGEWRDTVYGPINVDFSENRLADLCYPGFGIQTGPFGSQLHKKDYVPVGTPIITVEHLGENRILHEGAPCVSEKDRLRLSKYWLRKGDIVFSRVGSVDRRALVRDAEDGWLFSGRCLRVRPNSNHIDAAFLSYFFGLPSFGEHIRSVAVGATMPSLNTQILSDIRVPHPKNLGEQRSIAHILGTLDDKIELNRRMNQTLEEMARALFKSWFVDFDPVHAKATLKHRDTTHPQGGSDWSVERTRAYLDGMDPNIAALFPDSFVDSELGPIPRGWEVKALGDVVVNSDSKRIPVSKARRVNRPGIFPYYGAAGLMDYIDGYIFDGIYLLIGEDGSVVKSNDLAVTQYVWGRLWVNNHAHVLQGRGCVSTEQLYLYFNFEPVGPYVTGAVQPKLSQGRMNTMPFVFAGDDVCRAFATAVDPWFAKLRSLADASKILGALRDTMLPKLLLGEIRIKDIAPFGSVPQLAR